MFLDLLNNDEEMKKEKEAVEKIDHTTEERRLVIYNIPCLTTMLMNKLDSNKNSEEIFVHKVLPLFNQASQDSADEVRVACSRIFSQVSE